MPEEVERRCCQDYSQIRKRLEDDLESDAMECITQHEGFAGNCMNKYVLETSLYEFKGRNGPFGNEKTHSKVFRYIAYRRFVRFIFGVLAKYDRRILPACVVSRIRAKYPSDFYHGFKYSIY